ncbi:hypothetical protein HD554DRAFT_2042292 [Boletus coccyginus]|nr:hypothetical protein HD554DRAFT_2042292 [Boletus coccyginus]
MAVFDGVCYSLSPSLPPTRRNELAAVLDLNGAAPHPPYTHLISPSASHTHINATGDPAVKLVTDRWVDRSIVMGKRQPEQYYSPDPAMIFSGVVACATDLSVADLEVLSAGITALGGQWRAGLTRDVTHLFALRTGSDKVKPPLPLPAAPLTRHSQYNTALHFAPQTHMCILTPHWFDDAVRLGSRIPESPYAWPDPSVLRPGMTLTLSDDPLTTEGRRKRRLTADTDVEAGDGNNSIGEGGHVRVWAGRRILLSTSLGLSDGSRRAIEARIQRAGGVVVPVSEDADEDAEEKAVDESDVLVTRWRSGKSYFKAARTSHLIGTLSWLFSVESSGTLHSPFDSLIWYPTPRGGIPDLVGCEISITNYTGAARDYLKRLITLVGAKFTPSMSQSNKVLVAGFQPSPKTTRALSWSIPVVNHTWLEDCFVEWRALTVGLERYIVYPPGVDFGKILMTRQDGPPSSQSVPSQHSAVPGGRGIDTINVDQEETRDAEYRARAREGRGLSHEHEAFADATTADGMSEVPLDGGVLTEIRARPRSQAGSMKKRGSMSAPITVSATGAFVDHVIELPADDDDDDAGDERRTTANGKQRASASSVGSRGTPRTVSRPSSAGLFSTARGVEVIVRNPGGSSKDGNGKDKGKGKGKTDMGKRQTLSTEEVVEDQPAPPPKTSARLVQHGLDVQTAQTEDEVDDQAPELTSEPRRPRASKVMIICSDSASHSNAGKGSEVSVPPRKAMGAGSATPIKSGMRPKSLSGPRSVLGRESEDESRVVAAEYGTGTGTGKRRGVVAKPTRNSEVVTKTTNKAKIGEVREAKKLAPRVPSPTGSPPQSSPGMKNSRTPKRRLSVLVPSVPKEYFSSQSECDVMDKTGKEGPDSGETSGTRHKRLTSTASTHAVAAETSTSTNKRGKPSPAKISAPPIVSGKSGPQPRAKAKSKPSASKETTKTRADDDEDPNNAEADNDASMIVDSPVTSTSRVGPRRSAANKATTRLREEIMPDVVSFEKEQKQAKRRRSVADESIASVRGEEEKEEKGGKRRKVVADEEEEEEEEEAEVEDVVLESSVKAKPKRIKGNTKGTATVGLDEDMDDSPAKNKSSEKKGARGRGKELAAIRLMTTGVVLSDDVIKRLTKLGILMTTKPMDCTHLIAKGIVRTEKFLCAMSVSPHILTEEWANASAKCGKLLPESGYPLSDAAAEQKWAFKFMDAMARAKGLEGGPNLFKQMTFYVTPKVSVDVKLLKNVISAGGGQVQISTTPTVRILKGKANRYVISCQEDQAIWRPLMREGFKVYSPELVLRGALRQEIEWEKDECVVAG